MRPPKAQQELYDSSEHLHYELHMMRDSAKLLSDNAPFLSPKI